MKFASLQSGRDGALVLVSRDLALALDASAVAATLQSALDNWLDVAGELEAMYRELNRGERADAVAFNPAACAAPLPRAYQWADGSAYVNHVELVRQARGAQMPESFWQEPLLYQGGSDDLLASTADITHLADDFGLDFEAELAVITDDVPLGTGSDQTMAYVRLLMLVNDVSLRGLIPGELGKGFGFYQSKPATAFAPVAVTPDELGGAWRDGRVHLPVHSHLNGELFGRPQAGEDMTFSFARLISHACRTRNLGAGTIIGSGTVSNKQGTEHGSAIADGGVGYSCLAELRTIETIRDGAPDTPFLQPGDQVRIEVFDDDGVSVFGAIDQCVVQPSSSPQRSV